MKPLPNQNIQYREFLCGLPFIISTVSNGPDNGALDCDACHFHVPIRHGSTSECANNIKNKLHPAFFGNEVNIGAHGSKGNFETGTGQSPTIDIERQVHYWNNEFWEQHFSLIRDGNYGTLTIYACDTGAGEQGAELLYKLAKCINRNVRARTGMVFCTSFSDGRCEISYSEGSDWQLATPNTQPNPKLHGDNLLFPQSKTISILRNSRTEYFTAIETSDFDFFYMTIPSKTRSSKENNLSIKHSELKSLLPYFFYTEPFEMKVAPFAYITAHIKLSIRGEEKKLTLYNDRFLIDESTNHGYYTSPLLGDYLLYIIN